MSSNITHIRNRYQRCETQSTFPHRHKHIHIHPYKAHKFHFKCAKRVVEKNQFGCHTHALVLYAHIISPAMSLEKWKLCIPRNVESSAKNCTHRKLHVETQFNSRADAAATAAAAATTARTENNLSGLAYQPSCMVDCETLCALDMLCVRMRSRRRSRSHMNAPNPLTKILCMPFLRLSACAPATTVDIYLSWAIAFSEAMLHAHTCA